MGTITAKDGYKKYYVQVNGIMIVYRYVVRGLMFCPALKIILNFLAITLVKQVIARVL